LGLFSNANTFTKNKIVNSETNTANTNSKMAIGFKANEIA
jgi:hypothetical protein